MQHALALTRPDQPPVVLRRYQSEAIASVCRDWRDGHRNCYIEQATGTGKTTVFSWIASRGKGRVLLLAHRDLLIRQIAERLALVSGGEPVGIEQASRAAQGERMVVGSIDSLASARRLGRFAEDAFECVIVDECHRVQSPTYLSVLGHFGALPGGRTLTLGVTATPDRLDERAIAEVFPRCSYRYDVLQGIDEGHLVPVVVRHLDIDIDLSSLRGPADTDVTDEQADAVMASAMAVEGVARASLAQAGDRPTVIFTTSVDTARAISGLMNRLRPGCAVSVDGSITGPRREAIIAMFRAGRVQYVVNVDVLGEGWDHPPVSCVVLARPTKSRAKLCQQIGRGLRPSPGKGSCLVLDLVANTEHMGLCTPIDALAGAKYGETVAALAREAQEKELSTENLADGGDEREQTPAHELIHAAREELARRERSKVSWTSREGTAFGRGGQADHRRSPPQAASDKQVKICAWLMCPDRPWIAREQAAAMTVTEARKMIAQAESSRPRGSCSLSQQALLARFGVTRILTKAEASKLIDSIANNGWRLPEDAS